MIEYRKYKESGKINAPKLMLALFGGIILSYFLGLLYAYLKTKFYGMLLTNSEIMDTNRISWLLYKATQHGVRGIIILTIVILLPSAINIIGLIAIYNLIIHIGECRNTKVRVIISFLITTISILSIKRLNFQGIESYIELIIYWIFSTGIALNLRLYYCEGCKKVLEEKEYYTSNNLEVTDYIKEIIESNGISEEIKYTKLELKKKLQESKIHKNEKVYIHTLHKCESCDNMILDVAPCNITESEEKKAPKVQVKNKIISNFFIANNTAISKK